MPQKQRYARQLGFRRANGHLVPYKAQFGYGGAGYGGFGQKGRYGGYRSHYPYHDPNGMKLTYQIPNNPTVRMGPAKKASVDDWIPARAYSDSTTFSFGLVLLVIIALGLFFGMKRKSNPFIVR